MNAEYPAWPLERWKPPCDILNYEVTTVKFISVIACSSRAACEFCRHGYGDTCSLAMSTWGRWSCRVSISATSDLTLARQAGLYFLGGDQFWTPEVPVWCDFRQHCDISVTHRYYWWMCIETDGSDQTTVCSSLLVHSHRSQQLVFRKWYLVNETDKICSWLHDKYATLASSLCVKHVAADIVHCIEHWWNWTELVWILSWKQLA